MLEMCNTLKEAITYMYQSETTDLIDGCLDMLVSINSTLLENDVTEFDFNIITNISDEFNSQNVDLQKVYDLVFDLENEIKTNAKYKLKVLFVAELAGKWDSMASVYDAMKKRDNCEVQVVIEPVFRAIKMPDGTTKSDIILNDYLTPMGIPNIPYNKYNFETELPDITFFSQPYESCTIEKFWPENMSKFTKIVYLPYFAAITLNEVSSAFKSFFNLRTQKYSWRIACQSQVMKEKYEKYASRRGKNVIVTGIPKWDYPLLINRENTPMPDEWKDKIDGKKVFLWNTHFSLDTCGSQLLTPKAFEFLEYFSSREDIALIWRRHPMLETVIKVYYPEEVWMNYLKLKEFVENSDNMVIDDYPEYAQSFVWSDALISDFSTLMDQYIFMDKPILMLTKDDVVTTRKTFFSETELCDYGKLEFADTLEKQIEFIQNVCEGKEEIYLERQNYIRENYFVLADGKCGERISENLINDFIAEADLPHRSTDIIICGSEKDSEACIKQLNSINVDYLLCDMFLPNIARVKYATLAMEEIADFSYESIVVTDRKNFDFIKHILMSEYNVPEEKIMDFWRYYDFSIPKMVCDKVMLNPTYSQYSGIILGISHTEVGVLGDYFEEPFCNLAVSSQDLYYQYNTLLYCLENYPDKLKSLKYAIVDLYDYNYFNYDTSLSKGAVNYWLYGGLQSQAHNFNKNSIFKENYDDVMLTLNHHYYSGLTTTLASVWEKYFSSVYRFTDYKGFSSNYSMSNRMGIVNATQIDNYEYERKTVTVIHNDTIQENKEIFIKLLELLKSINPDIKIYTIVIPKYIETEKRDKKHLSELEVSFNKIVQEVNEKYQFTHLDLKKFTDISQNENFYYDAAHLNHYGAYMLTKTLNDLIFGDE